ncbi:pantoate--beta-alanine ligase [Candidatus Venteria ishoeyi]|uniref:Pantothenate synthetase n=1 Tax=Candidatus Venteria ishoeyi TaxID=1899563 RepID=A0A1H6F7A2_9GAMM|nr:pantoate--beta-alanine ligase [Candidatus Venteria ishoeyi]MDM8547735.1 pantoate--beta-alanine ligase [Candidatus Venteria ishoeyi]SEH04835.1 Pantothenate synthetase [Candidatus Venteria ishoeyi]
MKILNNIPLLQSYLQQQSAKRALVPTMGNLHSGHLSLVEAAKQQADEVVVSIFVNPLQFGPNEDFGCYPRTFEADCAALSEAGVDAVFAPDTHSLYPQGQERATRVDVPELGDILCGTIRPGHFVGVTSVVLRLLNLVRPDIALFGKKDYQQWLILRQMVQDLFLPIDIIGLPIIRDNDGLAKSSRNQYLSKQQRDIAPYLYQVLQKTAQQLQSEGSNYQALEQAASTELAQQGFVVDYFDIRRAEDLLRPDKVESPAALIILVAAKLGNTRLIDNYQGSSSNKVRL